MNTKHILKLAAYTLLAVLVLSQWLTVLQAAYAFVMDIAHLSMTELQLRISQFVNIDLSFNLALLVVTIATAIGLSLVAATQWAPNIKAKAPLFLDWSAKIYVDAMMALSLIVLYLSFSAGNVAGMAHACLIAIVAYPAFALLKLGALASYQAWALRSYLVISTWWMFEFFGLPFELPRLSGVALELSSSGLALIASVLALGVFELYRHTLKKGSAVSQLILATSLSLITILVLSSLV